jgi:hydrogenase nickel incorporation protein HypB
MCATCGCEGGGAVVSKLGEPHHHEHHDDHGHDEPHHHHDHEHPHTHLARESRMIELEQDVLHRNNRIAERNRGWLAARKVAALNLVSSPGSGKTTLLEHTLKNLRGELGVAVIEGDQTTQLDAERIGAAGAPVVQVNTGTGCHLDAEMVSSALEQLQPPERSVVFIENVGNLVCPALFDLGERDRVVLLSVTEGEDKPLKYPTIFNSADVAVITKMDLAAAVEFDLAAAEGNIQRVRPGMQVMKLSAKSGEGMREWLEFLGKFRAGTQQSA